MLVGVCVVQLVAPCVVFVVLVCIRGVVAAWDRGQVVTLLRVGVRVVGGGACVVWLFLCPGVARRGGCRGTCGCTLCVVVSVVVSVSAVGAPGVGGVLCCVGAQARGRRPFIEKEFCEGGSVFRGCSGHVLQVFVGTVGELRRHLCALLVVLTSDSNVAISLRFVCCTCGASGGGGVYPCGTLRRFEASRCPPSTLQS